MFTSFFLILPKKKKRKSGFCPFLRFYCYCSLSFTMFSHISSAFSYSLLSQYSFSGFRYNLNSSSGSFVVSVSLNSFQSSFLHPPSYRHEVARLARLPRAGRIEGDATSSDRVALTSLYWPFFMPFFLCVAFRAPWPLDFFPDKFFHAFLHFFVLQVIILLHG